MPTSDPGLKENLLQVNVFFQSLNVRQIDESPTYGTGTLVVALGGALSLYLGISVSMVFEIIELVVDILINLFTFCALSGKMKKQQSE